MLYILLLNITGGWYILLTTEATAADSPVRFNDEEKAPKYIVGVNKDGKLPGSRLQGIFNLCSCMFTGYLRMGMWDVGCHTDSM